jgi:hypothetical protein
LTHEELEIVGEREVGVGEHECDLHGLLDRLLCVLCELSDYVDIGCGCGSGGGDRGLGVGIILGA